jgi:O-antigen/teichoic acid export membrane protein
LDLFAVKESQVKLSRLSKNILYNFLGQGLVLVLGFVAIRYVFTRLGGDALGVVYFTTTVSALLFYVLELGIGAVILRELSAHINADLGYIRDLIRTASLFCWSAYALLAVVIYFGAPFLVGKWVNLTTMDESTATHMVQVLAVGVLTILPRSLYGSLLRGLQRMEFNNAIEVGIVGLQQIGTILILALGGGLFHVVYWITACFGLGLLGYLLVSSRFFTIRHLIPGFSGAVVRRNCRFSANMILISMLGTVHMQADKVILSKLLPIGMVGFYGLAWSIVGRATLVASSISQAAFPSFSAMYQGHDRAGLLRQYRKLQDLLCFGTLPVLAAIPFAAVPLFSYLLSPEAAQALLLPVALLCVGTYMNSVLHMPYVFSLAAGKPEITTRLNFYALFVVLPATVLLVYFLGLVGAGMSWIFYQIFSYAYAMPRICSQCLEMPVSEWYAHMLRIFFLAGLTYGVAWMVLYTVGTYSLLSLALGYIGASAVFLIGAYLMMVDELRGALHGALRTVRVRLVEAL